MRQAERLAAEAKAAEAMQRENEARLHELQATRVPSPVALTPPTPLVMLPLHPRAVATTEARE